MEDNSANNVDEFFRNAADAIEETTPSDWKGMKGKLKDEGINFGFQWRKKIIPGASFFIVTAGVVAYLFSSWNKQETVVDNKISSNSIEIRQETKSTTIESVTSSNEPQKVLHKSPINAAVYNSRDSNEDLIIPPPTPSGGGQYTPIALLREQPDSVYDPHQGFNLSAQGLAHSATGEISFPISFFKN